MEMKNIYPIGTVVTLKSDEKLKFMIVGYFPTNESGESRHYSAIRYPMGVYDNRMYFFFNHEDVENVLHEGHKDEEFENLKVLMETHLKSK